MTSRKFSILLCFLMCFCVLSGCSSKDEESHGVKAEKDEYVLYYVSIDSTKLVPKANYFDKRQETEKQAEEMIMILTREMTSPSYKSVLPEKVQLQDYMVEDTGSITIDLSVSYYDAVSSARILCRAALVKSLTQIEGIDRVDFTVDAQPMMENDSAIGSLTADSFIDSNSSNDSNQVQDITVYYTNVTGDLLEPIQIPMNLGNNVSAEQLVIEQLIEGTDEKGYYNTIPKGTRLISVSTKDGVCYVDFSEEFMKLGKDVQDQVVIYSVVNSLCELSTVSKVSFTIEGEQRTLYNGNIPFNQIFERNLDIVDN
ncbi:MAG: GerMN domain-containing protein [Lachnospiraceae bacterium]|nr:GerMN domain-containing protein [Lachnospiraceae bacterium]